MLVALSALWGGSFFFVAIALEDLPPVTAAGLRVGIAAVGLNLLLLAVGSKIPVNAALWSDFTVMGLLNLAIPFSLIAWGQTHIDSALASIFNATTPFSTAIVAHFCTHDERMRAGRLLGVSIAFCGVLLIIGVDALNSLGGRLGGELAVFGATTVLCLWRRIRAAVFQPQPSTGRRRSSGGRNRSDDCGIVDDCSRRPGG